MSNWGDSSPWAPERLSEEGADALLDEASEALLGDRAEEGRDAADRILRQVVQRTESPLHLAHAHLLLSISERERSMLEWQRSADPDAAAEYAENGLAHAQAAHEFAHLAGNSSLANFTMATERLARAHLDGIQRSRRGDGRPMVEDFSDARRAISGLARTGSILALLLVAAGFTDSSSFAIRLGKLRRALREASYLIGGGRDEDPSPSSLLASDEFRSGFGSSINIAFRLVVLDNSVVKSFTAGDDLSRRMCRATSEFAGLFRAVSGFEGDARSKFAFWAEKIIERAARDSGLVRRRGVTRRGSLDDSDTFARRMRKRHRW